MDLPPKQTNYHQAFDRSLQLARAQSEETMATLGVRALGDRRYEIPVLNTTFTVDLDADTVTCAAQTPDRDPSVWWQVIVLHYLAGPSVWPQSARWLALADFAEARGYESNYRGRVLDRLCATAGREESHFTAACDALGATAIDSGDRGFAFQVFPKLAVAISWYRGDDEFPPNAAFLYPDNVLSFLPVEDVIVLSECLVTLLQGKPW